MNGLFASFIARTSVYVFGFLGVLVLSEVMPKEDFGKFSFVQSILEFSLILATLGSQSFYARHGRRLLSANIYRELFKTTCSGFGLAVILVFFALHSILETKSMVVVSMTLFVHAVNLLYLSALRGSGVSFAINYEAGLRSFLLVIAVLFISFYWGGVSLNSVFVILLFSQVCVFLYLYLTIRLDKNGLETSGVLQQSKYLWSSVCQFGVKKSDILVVGYLYSFETVAEFKVAFLFAESIVQFVQAYINTQSRFLIGKSHVSPDLIRVFRKAMFLSVLMVIGSVFGFVVFTKFFNYSHGVQKWYFVLLFYFSIKSIFVFHENLFALNSSPSTLGARASLELVFRLMAVCFMLVFGFDYFYVYFVLIVFEVSCYQWWSSKDFGCSVIGFFGGGSRV